MNEYEFLKLAVQLRCSYIVSNKYDKFDTRARDIFECVKEVFKGYQDVRTKMLEYKLLVNCPFCELDKKEVKFEVLWGRNCFDDGPCDREDCCLKRAKEIDEKNSTT